MKPLRKRRIVDLAAAQDFHDDVTSALEAGLKEGVLHAGIIRDLELSGTPLAVLHDLGRVPRNVVLLGQSVPATVYFSPNVADPFRYVDVTAAAALATVGSRMTDAGNTGAGAFTYETLHTLTLRPGLLASDGDSIEAEYTYRSVSSVDPAGFGVHFGATSLTPPVGVVQAGGDTIAKVRVVRTGPKTQRAYVDVATSVSAWTPLAAAFSTPTEDLSGPVVIRSSGYSESGLANIVVCKTSIVTFRPAGTGIFARVLIA